MDWSQFLTPTLGVGGLLALAVLMLLRGDLVTRKQADTMLQVKDAQIEFLTRANADLRVALRERDTQVSEMMVTARTTRAVLRALPEAAQFDHERGPDAPAEEG